MWLTGCHLVVNEVPSSYFGPQTRQREVAAQKRDIKADVGCTEGMSRISGSSVQCDGSLKFNSGSMNSGLYEYHHGRYYTPIPRPPGHGVRAGAVSAVPRDLVQGRPAGPTVEIRCEISTSGATGC